MAGKSLAEEVVFTLEAMDSIMARVMCLPEPHELRILHRDFCRLSAKLHAFAERRVDSAAYERARTAGKEYGAVYDLPAPRGED